MLAIELSKGASFETSPAIRELSLAGLDFVSGRATTDPTKKKPEGGDNGNTDKPRSRGEAVVDGDSHGGMEGSITGGIVGGVMAGPGGAVGGAALAGGAGGVAGMLWGAVDGAGEYLGWWH